MICSYSGMFRTPKEKPVVQAGHLLARGVMRLMREMGHAALPEFVPERGLRVDIMALTSKGEIWIIECKSCIADYRSDRKWQSYQDHCDRYFWAIDRDFPQEILPQEGGRIIADAYGAELLHEAPLAKLAPARRTKLLRQFALAAAWRLQDINDPARKL